MKRIGIIGGTFDPIHIGHIKSAGQVYRKLNLDKIIFIPTGQAPHKVKSLVTAPDDRLEMVRLAIKDYPYFTVSDIEIKREGYSYTIDTLKEIKKMYDDAELFYIIGADVLGELSSWKDYKEVFRICEFAVLKRPGFDYFRSKELAREAGALVHEIKAKEIDISSTELRKRIRERGKVTPYLSRPVLSYIKEKGLYVKSYITDIEEIKEDLQKLLSASRYEHSLSVLEEAVRLGEIYGADIEKCKLASLLHDCAKELTAEQFKWMDINLSPSQEDINNGYNKRILHGKAGRILAKDRYGIKDEEILDAIEYHITGRPEMSLLEKIIFIADLTEENRKGIFYDKIREELKKGLNEGLMAAFDGIIDFILQKNGTIGIDTIRARNYYIKRRGE